MKPNKQLHADATETGGAAATTTTRKKGYTPSALSDISAVANNTNGKWAATPAITLLWITQPAFSTLVSNFSTAVTLQSSTEGGKSGDVQTLRQMDKQMNTAVDDVKTYIERKFKKANAKAEFPRYGIDKEGHTYRLPVDRNKRLINLDLMIAAIHDDGFDAEEWGAAFWTTMKTNYAAAVTASSGTDGNISTGSAGLVQMAKQIEKVSTALRFVLRGNYPDTYKGVYRDWGWQKENY